MSSDGNFFSKSINVLALLFGTLEYSFISYYLRVGHKKTQLFHLFVTYFLLLTWAVSKKGGSVVLFLWHRGKNSFKKHEYMLYLKK